MTEEGSAIKSFAFFDLETTGLPAWECNKTKITEISIVAVSKDNFLATKDELPRVLHKLTLCFNPFKRISYDSERITKLTNEILEHERKFDENAGKTILGFLNQMQQPCVLIAHNGDKFDFPILKKVIDDLELDVPESIKVVDSLPIFKDIELVEEVNASNQANEQSEKDVGVKPLENDPKLENLSNTYEQKEMEEMANAVEAILQENVADQVDQAEPFKRNSTNTTPSTSSTSLKEDMRKLNETTPRHQLIVPDEKKLIKNPRKRSLHESSTVRKNLFSKNYKLASIYERFVGKPPEQSHYAESDVMNLLKCALAKKEIFTKLAENRAENFNSIKKLKLV